MLLLSRWWASYGYSGPSYCQRCSEVFRDHIIRQFSNSAGCTRTSPCADCKRVLDCFNEPVADVCKQIDLIIDCRQKRQLLKRWSKADPFEVNTSTAAAGAAAAALNAKSASSKARPVLHALPVVLPPASATDKCLKVARINRLPKPSAGSATEIGHSTGSKKKSCVEDSEATSNCAGTLLALFSSFETSTCSMSACVNEMTTPDEPPATFAPLDSSSSSDENACDWSSDDGSCDGSVTSFKRRKVPTSDRIHIISSSFLQPLSVLEPTHFCAVGGV